MRKFKLSKVLSWTYILAFFVILGLGVYFYNGFKFREGQTGQTYSQGQLIFVKSTSGNCSQGTIHSNGSTPGTFNIAAVIENPVPGQEPSIDPNVPAAWISSSMDACNALPPSTEPPTQPPLQVTYGTSNAPLSALPAGMVLAPDSQSQIVGPPP
jgi:hypothetical protein